MAVVLVGEKYKQEFDNVFLLVSGCGLLEGISAEGDLDDGTACITYGENNYVYDARIENARYRGDSEDGEAQRQGFTVWGATWFGTLRGEDSMRSADELWRKTITDVATLYHKRFSILTYTPQQNDNEGVTKDKAEVIARNFLNLFHPDFYNQQNLSARPKVTVFNADDGARESEMQDIYGISLRLALNSGGQSEYVIGKIYFERYLNTLRPMLRGDAVKMDKMLKSFHKGTGAQKNKGVKKKGAVGAENPLTDEEKKVKESALAALKKCILDNNGNRETSNFLNYLFMDDFTSASADVRTSGKRDRDTIKKLLSGVDVFNELKCDEVKVLYISHLQWRSKVYDVALNGVKALRFIFGLNDALTVKCLNCPKTVGGEKEYEILVTNNEILLAKGEGEEEITTVVLGNKYEEGMGVSQEDVQLVKDKGLINKHLRVSKCTLLSANADGAEILCRRICCDSQSFTITYDKKGVVTLDPTKIDPTKTRRLCKACQHPEMVYYAALDDKAYVTDSLTVDVNSMTLMEKTLTKTCSCCGRTFLPAKAKETSCRLCEGLDAIVESRRGVSDAMDKKREEAKELYKKYAQILPVLLRAFTVFAKKYCVEDDEVILFGVGKHVYCFDKVKANQTGIVKPVRKLK